MSLTATRASRDFPPPPVTGHELLHPITSSEAMHAKTQVTGVEVEQFRFENIEEGIGCLFRWMRTFQPTLLVVQGCLDRYHVKYCTITVQEITGELLMSMFGEVVGLFCDEGYWTNRVTN